MILEKLKDMSVEIERIKEERKRIFGRWVLVQRKSMGLSQREFAKRLYYPHMSIHHWEVGRSMPKDVEEVMERIIKLSE